MVSLRSLVISASVVVVVFARTEKHTTEMKGSSREQLTTPALRSLVHSALDKDVNRQRRVEDAGDPVAVDEDTHDDHKANPTAPTTNDVEAPPSNPPDGKPENAEDNIDQPDPNAIETTDPPGKIEDTPAAAAADDDDNKHTPTDPPKAEPEATPQDAPGPNTAVEEAPTDPPQNPTPTSSPPATEEKQDGPAAAATAPTDAPIPEAKAIAPSEPPKAALNTTDAPVPVNEDKPGEATAPSPPPTDPPVPTDPPTDLPKPTPPPTEKETPSPTAKPIEETPSPTAKLIEPTPPPTEKETPSPTTKAVEPTPPPTEKETPSPTAAKVVPAPTPTLDPKAMNPDDYEEGGMGAMFWLFLLLCIGGGAYYAKDKLNIQFPTGPGEFSMNGGGGGGGGGFGGGGTARNTKYEQVASAEDDEEWGWGDDGDNDDDIEMTPSFATDTNLHNRRPSNDQSPFQKHLPKKSPRRPSPTISQRMPVDSLLDMPNIPSTLPPPSTAPVAGLAIKKTGMSLGGAPKAISTPAPVSTGVPPISSSQGSKGFNPAVIPTSIGGNPLQITSLGKKKPAASPAKKAPAPAPEDDIFASMGLSAKPTFSHAPAPSARPAGTSSSTSRFATTQATSAPVTTAPSTFSSIQGAMAMPDTSSRDLKATGSGGNDDAEWGDDADLDDLLDI